MSKHALEVAKLAKKGEDGQFNPEMLIEPLPEELAYAMKSALARLPRGIHYP